MSGRSSIDALRRLTPITDVDAADVFAAAGRDGLLDDLTRMPFGRSARPRLTPRRRRLAVAAVALALVATATAATWVALSTAPARETTSVECSIQGVDTVIPSTSGDPAHDCAVEWKRELREVAPPLAAYDNGLGGVTVIPRSQTPPKGFKRLAGPQDVDLIQLQNSLDDYINGLNSACLGSTAATEFANARLAQFGFTGWTVALRDPANGATSGTNTCWNADIVDPVSASVTLMATGMPAGSPKTTFEKLAARLRPLTQSCKSLPAAVAAVRAAASDFGLAQSPRGYDLNAVPDNKLRCASTYETVGGTIFFTLRGPRG